MESYYRLLWLIVFYSCFEWPVHVYSRTTTQFNPPTIMARFSKGPTAASQLRLPDGLHDFYRLQQTANSSVTTIAATTTAHQEGYRLALRSARLRRSHKNAYIILLGGRGSQKRKFVQAILSPTSPSASRVLDDRVIQEFVMDVPLPRLSLVGSQLCLVDVPEFGGEGEILKNAELLAGLQKFLKTHPVLGSSLPNLVLIFTKFPNNQTGSKDEENDDPNFLRMIRTLKELNPRLVFDENFGNVIFINAAPSPISDSSQHVSHTSRSGQNENEMIGGLIKNHMTLRNQPNVISMTMSDLANVQTSQKFYESWESILWSLGDSLGSAILDQFFKNMRSSSLFGGGTGRVQNFRPRVNHFIIPSFNISSAIYSLKSMTSEAGEPSSNWPTDFGTRLRLLHQRLVHQAEVHGLILQNLKANVTNFDKFDDKNPPGDQIQRLQRLLTNLLQDDGFTLRQLIQNLEIEMQIQKSVHNFHEEFQNEENRTRLLEQPMVNEMTNFTNWLNKSIEFLERLGHDESSKIQVSLHELRDSAQEKLEMAEERLAREMESWTAVLFEILTIVQKETADGHSALLNEIKLGNLRQLLDRREMKNRLVTKVTNESSAILEMIQQLQSMTLDESLKTQNFLEKFEDRQLTEMDKASQRMSADLSNLNQSLSTAIQNFDIYALQRDSALLGTLHRHHETSAQDKQHLEQLLVSQMEDQSRDLVEVFENLQNLTVHAALEIHKSLAYLGNSQWENLETTENRLGSKIANHSNDLGEQVGQSKTEILAELERLRHLLKSQNERHVNNTIEARREAAAERESYEQRIDLLSKQLDLQKSVHSEEIRGLLATAKNESIEERTRFDTILNNQTARHDATMWRLWSLLSAQTEAHSSHTRLMTEALDNERKLNREDVRGMLQVLHNETMAARTRLDKAIADQATRHEDEVRHLQSAIGEERKLHRSAMEGMLMELKNESLKSTERLHQRLDAQAERHANASQQMQSIMAAEREAHRGHLTQMLTSLDDERKGGREAAQSFLKTIQEESKKYSDNVGSFMNHIFKERERHDGIMAAKEERLKAQEASAHANVKDLMRSYETILQGRETMYTKLSDNVLRAG